MPKYVTSPLYIEVVETNVAKDVRGLNLAKNLITKWDTIATVIRNLPALRDLNLKYVFF